MIKLSGIIEGLKVSTKQDEVKKRKSKDCKNNVVPGHEMSAEALKHSMSYTELLRFYVKSVKVNTILKFLFKVLFFVATVGLLIVIVLSFTNSLEFACDILMYSIYSGAEDKSGPTLSVLSIIIPAVSSMIVAVIEIPRVIASYLFNADEDSTMGKIIENLQGYDKVMFAMENRLEELLALNKVIGISDEEIKEPPKKTSQTEVV